MRNDVAIAIAGICPPNLAEPYLWMASDVAPEWASAATLRKRALVSVGAFSCSIAEGDAVAQSGVTNFALIADDNTAIGARPIDLFTRIGAENLSSSQVWQTYTVAAGDTSLVVQNPPGESSAAIAAYTTLHIGTEMVYTTAAHTAGSLDPFAVVRGVGGTIAAPHRASLAGYFLRTIPVTSVPVEWIGRRVIVYVNGQVWREGFLTDNPIVADGQIQFSFVAAENALSIERSGDYIPPNGTTLAPTNEYTPHQAWWIYYSFPELTVEISPGVTAYRTSAQICNMDDSDPEVLQWSSSARKFGEQWYHYKSDNLGWANYPRVFVRYEKNWARSGDDHGPSVIDLEVIQNGYYYGLYGDDVVEWCPIFDTGSAAFHALDSSPSVQACWRLASVKSSAFTAVGPSTIGFPAMAGAHSVYFGDHMCYASEYEATHQIEFKLSQNSVLVENCASASLGYQNKYENLYVGIVSRRNLRQGEVLNDAPNGNLFSGLPPLNVWGALFPSQYRPCEPDRWCKRGDIYPVRPRFAGAVHNVYHDNGCVLQFDAWPITREQSQVSLPCDVASAYWELGTSQVWTVALVPGVDAAGAAVSITWTEPDGVQKSATAFLQRYSTGDFAPYYAYKISEVTMADGSPCVGFGNWPGQDAAQITRPVRVSGNLGSICAQIIASGDGTSGRPYDSLGDGFGLPISATGALSFEVMSVSGISNRYWQFSPRERSYSDFLRLAALVSGCMIVCKPDGENYRPWCVRAGRPMAGEAVAAWTDADFIGLPVSGGDNGLVYSGYRIKTRVAGPNADPVETVFPDWLAADMLGQGEECSIDLTGVYSRPRMLTTTALAGLVDEVRDRFGTARRRWAVKIPIDIGLARGVGDVVAVTSAYLVSADGTVGANNALARIVSISHDLVGGTCDVEMISYAEYGAGYAVSIDAQISAISGTTYTLQFVSDGDATRAARQRRDRLFWKPASLTSSNYYYLYQTGGPGASGRMYGYFTAWAPSESGGSATFVRVGYASPTPSVGSVILIECYSTVYTEMDDAFKPGTDRLL